MWKVMRGALVPPWSLADGANPIPGLPGGGFTPVVVQPQKPAPVQDHPQRAPTPAPVVAPSPVKDSKETQDLRGAKFGAVEGRVSFPAKPAVVDQSDAATKTHAKPKNAQEAKKAALDPQTSTETLSYIAKSYRYDQSMLLAVVQNPHVSADTLRRIGQDNPFSDDLRNAVNKHLAAMKISTVAQPPSPAQELSPAEVQAQATSSSSVAELRELANHKDYHVRLAVARNQFTPPDVLAKLAEDPAQLVSADAKSRLAKP